LQLYAKKAAYFEKSMLVIQLKSFAETKQNFQVSFDKDFKKLEEFADFVENANEDTDMMTYVN
jgi:hypothetical protein